MLAGVCLPNIRQQEVLPMNPRSIRKATRTALLALLGPGGSLSLAQDIPVRNWEVPRSEMSKQVVGDPSVFSPIDPPCRLYDSRRR